MEEKKDLTKRLTLEERRVLIQIAREQTEPLEDYDQIEQENIFRNIRSQGAIGGYRTY